MDRVLERFRVIVVAGIPVGVLIGGVCGRLAMMLLRVTSPEHVHGVTSDDGFVIGRFTLAGTYNLLLLGAGIGLIGALAYQAVAPWLIGPLWFRRITVAAGSGAVVGSMLVHASGVDFVVLEPTWLAVTLFVALPASFGALIGVVSDRVARPTSWTAQGRRRWVLPIVLLACFPLSAMILLVLAPIALLGWLAVTAVRGATDRNPAARVVVQAAWLAIAVVGLVALVHDVDAVTGG